MTEAQLELLRDKYVIWDHQARSGPMDLRDYNRRAADALKAVLSEYAGQQARIARAETRAEKLRLLLVMATLALDYERDVILSSGCRPPRRESDPYDPETINERDMYDRQKHYGDIIAAAKAESA